MITNKKFKYTKTKVISDSTNVYKNPEVLMAVESDDFDEIIKLYQKEKEKDELIYRSASKQLPRNKGWYNEKVDTEDGYIMSIGNIAKNKTVHLEVAIEGLIKESAAFFEVNSYDG